MQFSEGVVVLAKNVDAIYEELKSQIINLDLLPGTKVKEEDLAKEFNISRTPIRGVISRLVKDSLLEVKPQKGTYVSKIDLSKINDYIYVRKSVEIQMISKICKSISEEQIQELENILTKQYEIIQMEPSIKKSKMFFHNDNLFHATMFKFAALEGVWKIIHTNAIPLNRARIMANLRSNPQVEMIYEQHRQMVQYLKEQDEKGAIEALAHHLDEGFDGIAALVDKYNDYFE